MEIHEYQARDLFGAAGVRVLPNRVIDSADQIQDAIGALSLPIVVKAQVHAGGRGKAGGVKFAPTAEEAAEHARNILGMTLRTKQTGEAGLLVRAVMLAEAADIDRELYLSILTDRDSRSAILIASAAGGVDIEETAETDPDAILRMRIDAARGVTPQLSRAVHHFLFPDGDVALDETHRLVDGLFRAYLDNDATMVEVNPVAVTPEKTLVAVDGKVSLDDNAEFRHKDWADLPIPGEQDEREVEAAKYGLNYIKVGDGAIGCMVNGAGLAMATMDVITLYGARPANFLDVGGGATAENVTAAFRILAGDPDVKAILVNIFGGIMKCDVIAEGILTALKSVQLEVPLIVRLEGTNVEQGREMIANSGLECQTAGDLSEAAKLAVAATKGQS